MIELNDLTRGFGLSFHVFKFNIQNVSSIYESLKNSLFSEENKRGILNILQKEDFIEFDYNLLTKKKIEVFENGKNILKEYFSSKISKSYLGPNYVIFIGSKRELSKVLNDIKNLTNIEIKRSFINSERMNEVYSNFQKIRHLTLSNETDPFIKYFGLNGDLTEKENWKDFHDDDIKIIEISGTLDTPFGPISVRIYNDCCGQLYKGKIKINEELVFWFKDFLLHSL